MKDIKESLLSLNKVLLALFPFFALVAILVFAALGFEGVLMFLAAIAIVVILFIAGLLFVEWVDLVFNKD